MLNKFSLFLFLIFLGSFSVQAQENYNILVHKGNQNFDQKKYDHSSTNFLEATKQKPKDFGAHYNLGNALYKKKMYKEAEAEYEKAQKLTPNKLEKAAALYNQGNVNMQNNNVEKATNFYKKALNLDPNNKAILKNLQIAKKKQQEKQNQENKNQQQNNQNKDNQNQQNQNQKDNKKQENPQNQEGKPNQNQQQGGENNGLNQGKGNDTKNLKNPKDQDAGKNIPKDLEKAILNRVEDNERETAKRIMNKNAYSTPQSNEKDW